MFAFEHPRALYIATNIRQRDKMEMAYGRTALTVTATFLQSYRCGHCPCTRCRAAVACATSSHYHLKLLVRRCLWEACLRSVVQILRVQERLSNGAVSIVCRASVRSLVRTPTTYCRVHLPPPRNLLGLPTRAWQVLRRTIQHAISPSQSTRECHRTEPSRLRTSKDRVRFIRTVRSSIHRRGGMLKIHLQG